MKKRYAAALAAVAVTAAHGQSDDSLNATDNLGGIEVIGVTPLPSLQVDLNKFPGNAHSISAEEIDRQNTIDVSGALNRRIGSVTLNTAQNNPFQNDLFYRGFLASPLVGSAIGLSVYVDGVRVNEGFGDTINWELIPQTAISGIDVIPGSNPLYGLNTLGGALSIRTKSGRDFQGTELDASAGSFGRHGAQFQTGGQAGNFDWYIAGNYTEEDGWREFSPTELYQAFGKLGWEDDATDVELTYTFADSDLTGNGYVPASTLERDRDAVHTFPDNIRNNLDFVNLRATRDLTDDWQVAGNVYYRGYEQKTLNGDAEVECDGADVALGLCEANGGELETEGEDRMTRTGTDSFGGTLQTTFERAIASLDNSFTLGVAYDHIESDFDQAEAESQIIRFGNSRGTNREDPFETEIAVSTEQDNIGVYFTDRLDLTSRLSATVSGRYQRVETQIRDRTGEAENQDLNSNNDFDRFSPAAGLTYQLRPELNFFGGYSEGFRVPTAAELTCADPDDPCNLPNAFVADPPLDPVIARTYEIGARGVFSDFANLRWNLSLFRTDLDDDLLFIVSETGGGGFFQNVGKTRREGVELGVTGGTENWNYFANYSWVNATYQSNETLSSVVDPDGVDVQDGDTIPAIPEHNFKFGAEYRVLSSWWVGADVQAATGNYLRGDDSNDQAKTDGYILLDLSTRYDVTDELQVWARVDNVADNDYETGGIRNYNAFADPIEEERFLAPGVPRAFWVGLKLRFGS